MRPVRTADLITFMCRLPSNQEISISCNPQVLYSDCFTFYTMYSSNLDPTDSWSHKFMIFN